MNDAFHMVWNGKVRFILLSMPAFQALIDKNNDSPHLKHKETDFYITTEAALTSMKNRKEASGSHEPISLELYICTKQSRFHFVGLAKLAADTGIKVRLF